MFFLGTFNIYNHATIQRGGTETSFFSPTGAGGDSSCSASDRVSGTDSDSDCDAGGGWGGGERTLPIVYNLKQI